MFLSRISVHQVVLRQYRYVRNTRKLSTKPSLAIVKEIGPFGFSLLIIPITTFFLGNWQVRRRKWKLELIEKLKEKSLADPVDLLSNLDDLEDLEYKKVTLRGEFVHDKEIYITPRTKVIDGGPAKDSGGLISSSAYNGLLVITPFHIENSNKTVLVNRGWIPKKRLDPRTRLKGQVKDTVDIVGVVRKTEARPTFIAKNNPDSKFWQYRDIPAMANLLNCDPIFIDADYKSTCEGGPIGGQTKVSLRNDHFSYFITWYTLSIATTYLWYKRFSAELKPLFAFLRK